MAISKEKKSEIIKKIKENIDQQKSIVFVETKGLKTKDLEILKKELKQNNCSFLIAKKTLLNLALKEKKMDSVEFQNQLGLAFGFEDEIAPVKIIHKKSLQNNNLKILGGFLENSFQGEQEMIALAKLPSKDILLARMVGSISAPITGFLNVLQGNIKGLIYALTAIKK